MKDWQSAVLLLMCVGALAAAVKAGRDSMWPRVWDAEESTRWAQSEATFWRNRVEALHKKAAEEVVASKCDDCFDSPLTCPPGDSSECLFPDTTEAEGGTR